MKITVIGRGNVGGGLARRWEQAGHTVTKLGRDGGDASDAEVVLLAVASDAIADALGGVSGLEGKIVLDATNAFHWRNDEFESLAHEVKSIVGRPVAKSFNCNYAALYDEIDEQRARPCNLYAAEEGAVEITERSATASAASSTATRSRASSRAPKRSVLTANVCSCRTYVRWWHAF